MLKQRYLMEPVYAAVAAQRQMLNEMPDSDLPMARKALSEMLDKAGSDLGNAVLSHPETFAREVGAMDISTALGLMLEHRLSGDLSAGSRSMYRGLIVTMRRVGLL